MKILTGLLFLIALTGCWSDEKASKSTEFMSNLNKCDNCKITKPFLVEED